MTRLRGNDRGTGAPDPEPQHAWIPAFAGMTGRRAPDGKPDRCRMGSGLRRTDESRSPDFLAGLLGEIVDLVHRKREPLGRLPQRGQTGQVAMLEQL